MEKIMSKNILLPVEFLNLITSFVIDELQNPDITPNTRKFCEDAYKHLEEKFNRVKAREAYQKRIV
jgi:hypothetical protein